MPRKESAPTAKSQQDAVMGTEGIENYELPKSLVTKIAKSVIPENAKLQKDVVLALTKGSTVFINYLTATAQDVATQRSHKTISAADVLKALEIIEFGDMIPGVEKDLEAYRALQKSAPKAPRKSTGAAAKEKEKEKAAAPASSTTATPKGKDKGKGKEKESDKDKEKEKEPAAATTPGSRSSARTRAKKQAAAAEEPAPAPAPAPTEDVTMAEEEEEDEEIAKFDEEDELEEEEEDEEDEDEEQDVPAEENGMDVDDENVALAGQDFDKETSSRDDD